MQRLFVQLNNKPLKLIPLVLIPVLILVLVASIIPPGVARADPGWYDSDWDYRKKITLESDNVSGSSNLLYFPVSIQVTDTDLASDARNDGWDILFTAGDETTKLQHEIESFNGTTGNLMAWVEIPSLSYSDDTEIYMYYGNSGVTSSSENVSGVWDGADYKMIQHLEESSGGANAITDSTSYDNDGTDYNTPTLGATGQLDGAASFNGTDGTDYIQVADSNSLDITTNKITLEAWIYPTLLDTGHRRIIIKSLTDWGTEPYYRYALWVNQDGLGFGVSDATVRYWSVNGTLTQDTWQHVAGTYNGTDQTWYINGIAVTTRPLSMTITANNQPLLIGKALGNGTEFEGSIDEVRVSATARSADWIKTSYNNQNNPGDFLDFGPEIGAPTVATTGPASSVEETSATVNGTLTDDGGEGCQYRFEYDFDASGEPYDYSTAWSTENKTSGETFSAALSSLSEGTVYYYRAQARNNSGTVSGSELTFLTKPLEPTGFTATTASSAQINLGWTKGTGAQRTLIMRKEGSYPQNITDGTQVYFDSGESTSDSGLLPSKTYFYSAWSEVTGSTQYSDAPAQANATTSSGQPTVIGGLVLPVNKAAVLAPWLFLGVVLAVVIARVILLCVRRRRSSIHRH